MHAVQLVIALLFAVAGYQEARRFARQTGRLPWGWPPWAWALVLGLSFVIGIILLAVAERQGRAAAKRATPIAPSLYATQSPIGGYGPDATILPGRQG